MGAAKYISESRKPKKVGKHWSTVCGYLAERQPNRRVKKG